MLSYHKYSAHSVLHQPWKSHLSGKFSNAGFGGMEWEIRLLSVGETVRESTLGIYLASQLGCKFLDIEDYYFPENQTERPYDCRTREEVSRDLLADLNKCENCVFAAVKGNYGQEVEALFTLCGFH